MKLLILITLVLLTSCAILDSPPDINMAKDKFAKTEMNESSNNFLEILSINKTNGVKAEIFGVPNYRLEFVMEVRFKKNAHNPYKNDFKNFESDKEFYKWLNKQPKISSSGNNHDIYFKNFQHFKKGDTLVVSAHTDFVKTENGWR